MSEYEMHVCIFAEVVMDKWNELRTAYKLAQLKTLSATAQALSVHRSTVMRHVDALEENLGVTLFQRNDKGYIPTEAGLEIMRLGEVTDSQFSQLTARLRTKEQTLAGKITITCVAEIAGMLMPSIKQYQCQHPKMRVDIIGDLRNFNLEYGEADLAVRVGSKPETPDNVPFSLSEIKLALCASKNYIEDFGMPDERELAQHKFIALKDRPEHLLWNEWIYHHVPEENIVVLASSQQILTHALFAGCGIGVLPQEMIDNNRDLVALPLGEEWSIPVWALVHRDMVKMPKIRKFVDTLLAQEKWAVDLF
ncbi:LysR family transcriptional regulator [Thalassomonas sp. RHCl1]|uniref:LysR family transcriptional regulator n=1 Tax=Thalassomonas sp. RHCl1 TaxID=2995320 RepID=UPI00248C5AEF|nr:LysR family transcriptional regulator [Thalassomonas sp. RHCl1]